MYVGIDMVDNEGASMANKLDRTGFRKLAERYTKGELGVLLGISQPTLRQFFYHSREPFHPHLTGYINRVIARLLRRKTKAKI